MSNQENSQIKATPIFFPECEFLMKKAHLHRPRLVNFDETRWTASSSSSSSRPLGGGDSDAPVVQLSKGSGSSACGWVGRDVGRFAEAGSWTRNGEVAKKEKATLLRSDRRPRSPRWLRTTRGAACPSARAPSRAAARVHVSVGAFALRGLRCYHAYARAGTSLLVRPAH